MITRREKRLIALMDMQCFIYGESGHRWIGESDELILTDSLKERGVMLNNKIYGGWDEALDAVDLALNAAQRKSLEEWFDEFIGDSTVTCASPFLENRVTQHEEGVGGVC